MSRAFVREDAGGPAVLPDLPVSAGPNWVTPRGLRLLRERLAARQADLADLRARPDRTDREPEAAAERDIRYLEARLASAQPVEPPADPAEVAFAVAVTLRDAKGRTRRLAIVGEDEADAGRGLVTPASPLARALLGLGPGEAAEWRGEALEVVALAPHAD